MYDTDMINISNNLALFPSISLIQRLSLRAKVTPQNIFCHIFSSGVTRRRQVIEAEYLDLIVT